MNKQPEIFRKLNRDNIEAYTPKYAVDIIVPYLEAKQAELGRPLVIWAPFSREEHNFVSYLREKGFVVYNTHFDPETGVGNDFLTFEPNFEFDIILDNPPFKNKTGFVEKCFEHNKPFALFLPINSFGDNGIPNLFLANGAEPQLLIPKQRTEFHNQKNNGISFKTVYICKDILPKQIIITDMNKVKLIIGEE